MGCLGDETKFHLVQWANACTPLSLGGSRIRKVRLFTETLLRKWIWRFGIESCALWRQVIDVKYGCVWGS